MGKMILIPYLSAGLGHLVLAQAIAHYLHRMRPDWDVRLMDAALDLDDELLQRETCGLVEDFLEDAILPLERALRPGALGARTRAHFEPSKFPYRGP